MNETHRVAIGIPVDIGIMKLLPAIKLLGVNDDQQLRRFPVRVQMPLDVMGIPTVKHLEQDLVDLLCGGLGNG